MKYPLTSTLGALLILSGCGGSSPSIDINGLDKTVVQFEAIAAVDANEAAYGATVAQLLAG